MTQKPVALASTLELYYRKFPSQRALLTLLQSWLFAAECEGVAARQPEYAEALKRAITALRVADGVPQAIEMLRAEEATLTC